MTEVYRGTVGPDDRSHSGSKKLTTKILEKIDFKDVIYGERSQTGAMGNAGGIILLVIEDDELIKYETNAFKDEMTALEALKQITLHEDLFDLYYGGMGNGVFINKKTPIEVDYDNKCFWYTNHKNRYRIDSSVYGVFKNVASQVEGEPPEGLDVMHKAWEQSLREKFLGKKSKNNKEVPKRKILYIEDDQAIAKVFNERFTDEGYEVSICDNGEDGLRATLDFKPDMIITGILMPKVSGFDVIDILKQTPETKDIPIVVLSALSRQDDINRAKNLGAIDYMVMSKVRVKDVLKRINELFDQVYGKDQS